MGGVDTARGINFQYAAAINKLIAFPDRSDWASIQLEGRVHIEDAVIRDEHGRTLIRIQIKQKSDGENWEPHDLRDVLHAFSQVKGGNGARYELVYTGAESPTFAKKIKVILEKIRHEGFGALDASEIHSFSASMQKRGTGNDEVATEVLAFLASADRRVELVKHSTTEGLMAQDARKLRRLLNGYGANRVAEDYEEIVYDRLFRKIALTTEEDSHYDRVLTRQEILELMEINPDRSYSKGAQP